MPITRLVALAGADAAVLITGRPDVANLGRDLASPSQWVARVGPDSAAATLATAALWCVAVWVAIGLLACLAAGLPGSAGRIGGRFARHVLPATVYRLVAGAAGLGVLLSPVAAGAAPRPPSAPAPAWPSDSALPPPAWPTTPGRPRTARPPAPTPQPTNVVVRPGDSLWSIAADHLPPDAGPHRVAREWPRWFAANRTVVGGDPDLIRPGQVLHAPVTVQEHQS